MRLKALERRAVSEGVGTEFVEGAMDGDDPKASLIALIVEMASRRGPAEQILSALQAGGETAAGALTAVLGHAIELVDHHAVSSPRRSRKPLMELLDRVESAAESISAGWLDGVTGNAGSLEELSGCIAGVEGLDVASSSLSDTVSCVSALMDCVDRCGNVVLRSTAVLNSGEADAAGRLDALEALRALSEARQTEISEAEVCAFGCVKELMSTVDVSECDVCVPA